MEGRLGATIPKEGPPPCLEILELFPESTFVKLEDRAFAAAIVLNEAFAEVFLEGINPEGFPIDEQFVEIVAQCDQAFPAKGLMKCPLKEMIAVSRGVQGEVFNAIQRVVALEFYPEGPLVPPYMVGPVPLESNIAPY